MRKAFSRVFDLVSVKPKDMTTGVSPEDKFCTESITSMFKKKRNSGAQHVYYAFMSIASSTLMIYKQTFSRPPRSLACNYLLLHAMDRNCSSRYRTRSVKFLCSYLSHSSFTYERLHAMNEYIANIVNGGVSKSFTWNTRTQIRILRFLGPKLLKRVL